MKDSKKTGEDWRPKVVKYALWSLGGAVLLIILGSVVFFSVRFQQYVNTKEGFSLLYPRGWTERLVLPEGGIVAFVADKQNPLDYFQDNISITYTDFSKQPISLEEYAKLAKSQTTGTFRGITFKEPQRVTLSGRPAYKLFFQVTGAVNLTIVSYVFMFNDIAYNITYAAMTDHYEKSGQQILNVVIASLKVMF